VRAGAFASTVAPDMDRQDPIRIIDGDEGSLARRVARVLETAPPGSVVGRFTWWYTGRPPLHEATVLPPPAPRPPDGA
jgi:hypothetical protein